MNKIYITVLCLSFIENMCFAETAPAKSEGSTTIKLKSDNKVSSHKDRLTELEKDFRQTLMRITDNLNNISMVDVNSPYYKYMQYEIVDEYLDDLDDNQIYTHDEHVKLQDILEDINEILEKIPRMRKKLRRSRTIKGVVSREGSFNFINALENDSKGLRNRAELLLNKRNIN